MFLRVCPEDPSVIAKIATKGLASCRLGKNPDMSIGMLRQYELVERVKEYAPEADEALLNRAYVYTVQKHGNL